MPVRSQRIIQNSPDGKRTLDFPSYNALGSELGPAAAVTNNLIMLTDIGTVPISNLVFDPYLSVAYVKVADYKSMRRWRTTDDSSLAYTDKMLSDKRSIITMILNVKELAGTNHAMINRNGYENKNAHL